jgi:hypothetical protein
MFLRSISAALAALLIMSGPALALDPVPAKPAAPVAAQAVKPGTAVVTKSVSGGTASVTVPASTEPQTYEIDVKPLIETVRDLLIALVAGFTTVGVPLLFLRLRKKWGVDIDVGEQNKVQSALTNIAAQLIARGAVQVSENGRITVQNADLARAANTVIGRVPDAMAHFNLTPEQVQQRIIEKLPQVLNTPAPPPDATKPA